MATRNVFFYEIRPTRQKDVEWRLNVPELVAELTALTDEQRIRKVDGNTGDSYEFVHVMLDGRYPSIAYARCREQGLPMLAQQVNLEPLTIDEDRELAELTHAVFFDGHIIGGEYNHYGPRLTSLAGYLADKVPQCLPPNGRVHIANLISRDSIDVLRDAKDVKAISLRMAPQLLDAVSAVEQIGARDGLRQTSSRFGAEKFGLSWRNRKGLDKDEILGLVNWALEQGSGLLSAASAEVELEDGTRQPVNLLRTRIGAEREMELMGANMRSIAHESAHSEIMAAFYSLEDQVKAASSLYHSEA